MRPLIDMANNDRLEVQRASALALYNISCAAANMIAMVKANTPPSLIKLCASPDVDCKRYAIMTLSNLAANMETRATTSRVAAGCKPRSSSHATTRSTAGALRICLCNMANNANTQVQIVVHGGLPPVLDLSLSNDLDSQRHALMVLANLAANESNHLAMMQQGALKTLITLSQVRPNRFVFASPLY